MAIEDVSNVSDPVEAAAVEAPVDEVPGDGEDLALEGLEDIGAEIGEGVEGVETPEMSPEEKLQEELQGIETGIGASDEESTRLVGSIEDTQTQLGDLREKFELPPLEDDPPSTSSDREQLENAKAEQKALKDQREELINKQEREARIREEKEKILQEKLDALFGEIAALNEDDLESVLQGGKTRAGRNIGSLATGEIEPPVAKSLARAFKEGVRLLPQILEILPDLLKKFDEGLTEEATRRVDAQAEENNLPTGEEQAPEDAEISTPTQDLEGSVDPNVDSGAGDDGTLSDEPIVDQDSAGDDLSAEADTKDP